MSGVLLLNASYEVLTVVSTRRALVLVLIDRAEIIEEHSSKPAVKTSGGLELPSPSVIRLFEQKNWSANRNKKTPPLTRRRVFTRDNYTCQVKGCNSTKEITLDHLHPVSLGGKNTWENHVSMCKYHNQKKGNKTMQELGWELKKTPHAPEGYMIHVPKETPEWEKYLSWGRK